MLFEIVTVYVGLHKPKYENKERKTGRLRAVTALNISLRIDLLRSCPETGDNLLLSSPDRGDNCST